MLVTHGATGWSQPVAPLPLAQAKLIADRGDWGSAVAVPQLADGKQETIWTSGAMDLRVSPANLFVLLPAPVAVGALELDTVFSKNAWRVTDFEVYGRVGRDWALIGKVAGGKQATLRADLQPTPVQTLRLRLRDNEREGHSWAVVTELRLYVPGAAGGAQAPTLRAAPVPDETAGERMFVAAALGELPSIPRTTFDSKLGYLHYARSFLDTMLRAGTDVYGNVKSPMFVSLLMLDSRQHPQSVIPSMPGQRIGDRALFGGNLQHDVPLLLAMQPLSQLTHDPRYGEAASTYLQFFVRNCTGTATGLWPWGEHAHWDFFKETFGHNLHEYLGAPPLELLNVAWQISPQAIRGEADGMLNHVRDLSTYQFCRHAEIDEPLTDQTRVERKGLDFPRHGAMFARHWAFTYSKTHDPRYLQHIEGMLKHFELVRQEDGTIPVLSKLADRSALGPAPGVNLSVGLSLLEAASLLGDTPTGAHCQKLGTDLLAVAAGMPGKQPKTAAFDMAYGGGAFDAVTPLLRMAAFRQTGDQRHLDLAKAFGDLYAGVEMMSTEGYVRAEAYGVLLNLYLDLDELDKDPKWLAAAEKYARFGIEDLYHDGLFRGASNLTYYDSELYVSTFVYGLVRLQARLDRSAVQIPPLYFHR
ncbi:hypothetical protein LLH23_07340 [bacterium]|nr:hypothetical protein [bacterium]